MTKRKRPIKERPNSIKRYASKMLKGHLELDSKIIADHRDLLEGHAIYLKGFFGRSTDDRIFKALVQEMEQKENLGLIKWSKHEKVENPEGYPVFEKVLSIMSTYFDVDILASRLNYYKDGQAWKPFHQDSHAYGDNGEKEDFTMGASFGEGRELEFLHPPSELTFAFPQNNNDIFAFDSIVNTKFQHGIPRSKKAKSGPRISIIGWGKRRSMNRRNGGMRGEARV